MRFNKSNVLDLIYTRMTAEANQYGFNEGDGRIVVNNSDRNKILAFGRFEALRDLLEDLT